MVVMGRLTEPTGLVSGVAGLLESAVVSFGIVLFGGGVTCTRTSDVFCRRYK
jgi:hypothetical protein